MSDQTMARIGRELARALRYFARERSDDAKKRIAVLHTELCLELRNEEDDEAELVHAARPKPVLPAGQVEQVPV